jgi:hypothetical protein
LEIDLEGQRVTCIGGSAACRRASIVPDPIRAHASLRAEYVRRPPVALGGKPGEDAGFRPQMGGLEPSLTLVNAVRRQASSLSPLNQSSPQSDK